MKIVIQRVKKANVQVDQKVIGKIGLGMVILLGVHKEDSQKDVDYLVNKLVKLRIFEDEAGEMNCSSEDVKSAFLVVSQFTLYGSCLKGRRPSFDQAASPKKAQELYEYFVKQLKKYNLQVETGKFQAMMDVALINDGPVTFVLDSNKELNV